MPRAVLLILLILLTFPVSLPLVGLLHALDGWRLRRAVAKTCCVRCGHMLNQASLDAADAAWAAEIAEMQRRFPGTRLRVVRHCRVLCGACGMEYRWNDRERRLHPLGPDDHGCDDDRREPANPIH